MKGPFGETLVFKTKLSDSDLKLSGQSVVFFIDSKLRSKFSKKFIQHPKVFLKGGENLKTLEQYQKNLNFLFKNKAHKKTVIVAVGGGSLLDSIAFLASTFLRGVDLVLIPTTWLSCIDASVGGKTALNFTDKKNQIGSFYPPKYIYFCEDLIAEKSFKEAQGEIVKTIFLNHKKKWLNGRDELSLLSIKELKKFIAYKTEVVKSDPYERRKTRMVLNLGHTFGHVVELSKGLAHGESVLYGLKFALEWSYRRKKITIKTYKHLNEFLPSKKIKNLNLSSSKLKKSLFFDKKSVGEFVNFVFINEAGPEVKKVSFDSFVNEYERQVKLGL